jgi:hypothetical protein
MMEEKPGLKGRSHGGGPVNSQAGRHPLNTQANLLSIVHQTTENEIIRTELSQNKSCLSPHSLNKGLVNSMSFRPVIYWLACSALAVIAVGAAEPGLVNPDVFNLTNLDASSVKPVPEPSRALLLFAGIMAMAFTYRKAWLNWKRGI